MACQCSLCEKFLHTQSVKLNIMGMGEWGNYGLNEHSIYDLNGWYSFGKVSYCFGGHAQRTLVFRGVLFTSHRMTTGFGPYELPTHGLLQKGRDHSLAEKACFE